MAAYYPSLTLGGSGGLESSTLSRLFSLPSRFWSIGPQLLATVFDAGRRRAITAEAQADYDAAVAAYRESVLTAFQNVEDNLAALRILSEESTQQAAATAAAERSLELARNRYTGGITSYLEVITAQNAALANERAAIDLRVRRMTASINLIKALGGGWSAADLPSGVKITDKQQIIGG
jgi:outer membrane protein TolC